MSRVGLNTHNHPRRPHLPKRSSSSLFEVITKKSIDQVSDLNFVAANLVALDEGVDDFRYPERSFFAFPQPLNTPYSRVRTVRRNMPSNSKESGIGEDNVRVQHRESIPKILYANIT